MRTLTHSLFSVLSLSIVAACVGDPNIDLDNRNDDEQIEEPAA